MSEKCPKCGADYRHEILKAGGQQFSCGSKIVYGGFVQKSVCRVRELEQQLATITADKESFGVKVHEAAVREGQWLALLGLLPGDDLGAAIKSVVQERDEYRGALTDK